MANLSFIENYILEDLFDMHSGYVLDFTDRTMAEYFSKELNFKIYNPNYVKKRRSGSKANFLRGFFEQENDHTVGRAIEKLIGYVEYLKSKKQYDVKDETIEEGRKIAARLLGEPVKAPQKKQANSFSADCKRIDFSKIVKDSHIEQMLVKRINEVCVCFDNGAYLATIVMAGAILEGVLLGCALQRPKEFNQSKRSPKQKGSNKPLPFHEWSLAQRIDVAEDLGLLDQNMQKFGHSLRDYRNYIHPYEQLSNKFEATEEAADISLRVLLHALRGLMAK